MELYATEDYLFIVWFNLFMEFIDSEDALTQLVLPSEFYFSSSLSSFRDAGGDRTASHSHHSDCGVAAVVDGDSSDHGAVQNYNTVWIRIPL